MRGVCRLVLRPLALLWDLTAVLKHPQFERASNTCPLKMWYPRPPRQPCSLPQQTPVWFFGPTRSVCQRWAASATPGEQQTNTLRPLPAVRRAAAANGGQALNEQANVRVWNTGGTNTASYKAKPPLADCQNTWNTRVLILRVLFTVFSGK